MNKAAVKTGKNRHFPEARNETRDAVENAIDKAKEDRTSTWETVTNVSPNRVGKWKDGGNISHRIKSAG